MAAALLASSGGSAERPAPASLAMQDLRSSKPAGSIVIGEQRVVGNASQIDAGTTALVELGSQDLLAGHHRALEIAP